MQNKLKLVIFTLIFISAVKGYSAHIIGGSLTYTYLSSPTATTNLYKLSFKMYRDCRVGSNGAPFDGDVNSNEAALASIYSVENGIFDSNFERTVNFGRPIKTSISANSFSPCLTLPSGLCVQEGVYEITVELPIIDKSYYVIYQRCCRNNTITNLINPGQVGVTFYTEITPEAQLNKNSSPIFKDFPPIAICADFLFTFDHSATDLDGDNITYSFYHPSEGGGPPPSTNGCNGVAPNPDCPPPFNGISYRLPYTYDNPMGGTPSFSIDPNTGILTGNSNTQGQFVVGILAKEFRNGVLISETRREFQFNVVECERNIVAEISVNNKSGKDVELMLCGDTLAQAVFTGLGGSDIVSFDWKLDGPNQDSLIQNKGIINIPLPNPGEFSGNLIINKGTQCADTAYYTIHLFPDLLADFKSDYDTCFGTELFLSNLTLNESGGGYLSIWKLNNNIISNQQDMVYVPPSIQPYTFKLVVTDNNQCKDSITKVAPFVPVQMNEIKEFVDKKGCAPFTVLFENPVENLTNLDTIIWTLNENINRKSKSFLHTFENPGNYNVSLKVELNNGCVITKEYKNNIKVFENPKSGFEYEPKKISNFSNQITISDISQNSVQWNYDFGEGHIENSAEPTYSFQDTGIHKITQIVFSKDGCIDSSSYFIDVEPKYTLFMPTAFSPNDDGLNDEYIASGIPFGVKNFNMSIIDRNGSLLFETDTVTQGWDGRAKNGEKLIHDIYTVKISFKEPRGLNKNLQTTCVLME